MTFDYDPFSPEVASDPLPIYRELRAAGGVHRLEQYHGWALPRFAELWEVSCDRESFTIAEGPVFMRDQVLQPAAAELGPLPAGQFLSFSQMDPPAHTQIRKILYPPLRPRPVAELEAELRRVAADCVEAGLERGRLDVVTELASPVSVAGTSLVLGFPFADGEKLVDYANQTMRYDDRAPAARAKIQEYLCSFVAEQRAGDCPEYIEALLGVDLLGHPFDDQDAAIQLSTLFTGGVETTPKVMAGGFIHLAAEGDQRAALAQDASLSGGAFEEMLRLEVPIQHLGRTVSRPTVIGGQEMAPGDRVFLLYQSANRDEREFGPSSESFDIHRRPLRQLGFGHGLHYCIGAHLARLEGRVIIEEALARIPDFEVPAEEVVRLPGSFQQGYASVPIVF
ncbi:cytochrome P450 [Candidatus Poriferisocius sp.]|uniref:cytochrome P450 n=1 Tax=Candidatus Poriferisocius sp. TaxID=3101276 RepID=UPI003B527A27